MKALKIFIVVGLSIIPYINLSAQELNIDFELMLDKRDSTLVYKVVNNSDKDIVVIKTAMNRFSGSNCYVTYRDVERKEHTEQIDIAEKFFTLKSAERYVYKIDLSRYMQRELISIWGDLFYSYLVPPETKMRLRIIKKGIDVLSNKCITKYPLNE